MLCRPRTASRCATFRSATVNLETDGVVLQAVVDEMIRPQASRLGPGPAPVVIAIDSTVPVCLPSTPLGNPVGCMSNWHLQALADPLAPPGALMFEGQLTPSQRVQLASALLKRNDTSHPIPNGAITNATMVAPRDIEGQRPRLDATRGIVSFSAPAYGGDALALVYAVYRCGELCGYGWFVLLERRPGGWDVVAHRGLWVS